MKESIQMHVRPCVFCASNSPLETHPWCRLSTEQEIQEPLWGHGQPLQLSPRHTLPCMVISNRCKAPCTKPFLYPLALLKLLHWLEIGFFYPPQLLSPSPAPSLLLQAHCLYFNLYLRHHLLQESVQDSLHPCCVECSSPVLTFRVCVHFSYRSCHSLLLLIYTSFSPTEESTNTSIHLAHSDSQPSIWPLIGDLLMFYELKWTPKDSLKCEGDSSKNLIAIINLRLRKLI